MLLLTQRIEKTLNILQQYECADERKIEKYKFSRASVENAHAYYTHYDDSQWQDFKETDMWGGYDQNYWFRTIITIPPEWHGQEIIYEVITGRESFWDSINPQFKMYQDGELKQGLDHNHRTVLLTKNAKGGEVIAIALHAHSGLEPIQVALKTRFYCRNHEVSQLFYDLQVPLEALATLPDTDYRKQQMLETLNNTVNLIDFREPKSQQFLASIMKARQFIASEFYDKLEWKQGPVAKAVGHTHIDIAWRWTVEQTRDKVVRSFATALELMNEYPEYIFTSSQPQLYEFVKQREPGLYHKIKTKIQSGQWEPEGAMWVEPDCNLISGESLVRQILVGTRFFETEFGCENTVHWMPDVFGYSAALPQILKKSGIQTFITYKLSWNEYNKMPYDTFQWQGIDGTEILTHFLMAKDYSQNPADFYTVYGGMLTASQTAGAWQRYQQKDLNQEILFAYGYGDGGGGPTVEMLENARRLTKGVPGCPKVEMSTINQFTQKLALDVTNHKRLPKWVGELYLEYHRGTYTSRAANKWANRRCEFLYQDLEWVSVLAQQAQLQAYPKAFLQEQWKIILRNQFHDILPGCSIAEVYEVTDQEYATLLATGTDHLQQTLQAITNEIVETAEQFVVFNSAGFAQQQLIAVPSRHEELDICTSDGQILTTQRQNAEQPSQIVLTPIIPAKGYTILTKRKQPSSKAGKESPLLISTTGFETPFLRAEIAADGTIASLFDKVAQRELILMNQKANQFQLFEDYPLHFDAWDINKYYSEKQWPLDEKAEITVLETGSLRAKLQIIKHFSHSSIKQELTIYAHTAQIDFQTTVDWQEKNMLLKVAFPIDVQADQATYEIQYGHVSRATHQNTSWDAAKFEVCAHKWVDLAEDGYGVSLLNDCKYGHDIAGTTMRLTLLKSAQYPMVDADKGIHEFTYSLYPHCGDWRQAQTLQQAGGLNNPLFVIEPTKITPQSKQISSQFVELSADNIIVEVIKQAEDDEMIIMRMYEAYKRRTTAKLKFSQMYHQILETNLLERDAIILGENTEQVTVTFKPFEIKTFKLIPIK